MFYSLINELIPEKNVIKDGQQLSKILLFVL